MELVLLVLAAAVVGYLLYVQVRLNKSAQSLQTDRDRLSQENAHLRAENAALAPYRAIRDADAEARRIVWEARTHTATILQEAESRAAVILHQASEATVAAEREAREIILRSERMTTEERTKAWEEAARIRGKAEKTLADATAHAESSMRAANAEGGAIINAANQQAQAIAGSALEAVQNAERYERVAKAMKNIIDGYGDQYVIPSHSLLDDLAAEYGFTEAGAELKHARERSRLMVKNHTAAICDYVEASRRETAIRFVVDAFNGKVDSVLTRVRETNVGTLEQEIRDAYHLVNENGAAFRNPLPPHPPHPHPLPP